MVSTRNAHGWSTFAHATGIELGSEQAHVVAEVLRALLVPVISWAKHPLHHHEQLAAFPPHLL